MAYELATAYVNIVPSTKGLGKKLAGDFDSFGEQASRSFSNRFSSMLGTLAKRGTQAAGVAIGAAIGRAAVGGFTRFANLEDANKRLEQMGLATEQVDGLMSSLLTTVKGTPFALDAGASAVARFVSAGMDLDRIPAVLDMMADAAAFGQAPLEEIAGVFGRIQTQGRLTAMEMNMLTDRDIPAWELLADAMGLSVDELRKMVSEGKVGADDFFSAWEEGAEGFGENNIKMAGAAKSAGDTTRGAWANMLAALDRAGATVLAPLFERMQGWFSGLGENIDVIAERIAPVVEGALASIFEHGGRVGEVVGSIDWSGAFDSAVAVLTPVAVGVAAVATSLWELGGVVLPMLVSAAEAAWPTLAAGAEIAGVLLGGALEVLAGAIDWVADNADWLVPIIAGATAGFLAWKAAVTTVQAVTKAFTAVQAAFNVVMSANPIMLVVIALGALVAGLVWAYQNVQWFRDAVDSVASFMTGTVWPAIQSVASVIGDMLVTAVDVVIDLFNGYLAPALRAAAWIVTDVVIPALSAMWRWFSESILPILGTVVGYLTGAFSTAMSAGRTAIGWVVDRARDLWGFLRDSVLPILGSIADFLRGAWDRAFSAAKTAVGWVVDRVGDLRDGVVFLLDGAAKIADFLGIGGVFRAAFTAAETAIGWVVSKLQAVIDALAAIPGKAKEAWDSLTPNIPEPRSLPGGKGQPAGWRQQIGQLWPFAKGGPVTGGIPGVDSVPALLMPGEFVLRKSAVDRIGVAALHGLNSGQFTDFAHDGSLSAQTGSWGQFAADFDAAQPGRSGPAVEFTGPIHLHDDVDVDMLGRRMAFAAGSRSL